MKEPTEIQLKEIEAWLNYVVEGALNADTNEERSDIIRNRAWFCSVNFEQKDFLKFANIFEEYNSNASFAVLGRDIEKYAETIIELDNKGFDMIFHGQRHHQFDDLSYDEAHDYLSEGLEKIHNTTGIVPKGMFVPMSNTNQGTLDALADLDFEWVVGKTDSHLEPHHPKLINPQKPYDDMLFEKGYKPDEVFDQYPPNTQLDTTYVIHPPYQLHNKSINALIQWIKTVQPISVSDQIKKGKGTSVILDCYNPFVVK